MNLNDIKSLLPDYAKDLRLNLDSVLSESGAPGLVQKQIAIIALAIMVFGLYVVSTSMWGVTQRWQARKRPRRY